MKRLLALAAVLAALAVPAGTVKPANPPAASSGDAAIDTMAYPTYAAADVAEIDTIVMGWAWSPWPGVYINTRELPGMFIFVQ